MSAAPRPEISHQLHRLPNGLRVVLHEDHHLPLVALSLWYHVGSKNERRGRTGLAHLFEHMLFQGSAHVGTNDHFRLVQQVGGVANGSTWYDRTNYYETLPASALDLGLWLESDRMGFLLDALTEEKLANQRQVVINERRQRVDNQPYGRALEVLHELLYPEGHPYRWPVIGYLDDIVAATLDDVREFFSTYYVPRNAVLTLAGDFEPSAALARVAHWFGDLPAASQPPRVPRPETAPADGEGRSELPDAVRLPRVYFGYRAPAYGTRDWYAAAMLAAALASGKASVLHQDLVYRRQIAQEVGVYLYPTELEATMIAVATAKPGVAAAEIDAALDEHLARAASAPTAAADLERARNQVLTNAFEHLETVEAKADLLSHYTTYFDDPGRLGAELAAYESMTPDDLRAFAARHLTRERRVVVTVVPDGSGA
jgi:zinc protease